MAKQNKKKYTCVRLTEKQNELFINFCKNNKIKKSVLLRNCLMNFLNNENYIKATEQQPANKLNKMNLQKQLKYYCDKHNIKPYEINHGTIKNPFPIGRRAVYDLYLNNNIGTLNEKKLLKFFKQLKTLNNDKQRNFKTS